MSKKVTKKAVKAIKKVEKSEKVSKEIPSHLKDSELNRILLADMKLELALQKIKDKSKDIRILELNSQLIAGSIAEKKQELLALKKSAEQCKIMAKDNYTIISQKYKLPNGWGLNDETGEIIIED